MKKKNLKGFFVVPYNYETLALEPSKRVPEKQQQQQQQQQQNKNKRVQYMG